jgi:hypothetical protein
VNGTNKDFTHSPEGRDASLITSWTYGTGELRFFALDQWSSLGFRSTNLRSPERWTVATCTMRRC